MKQMGIESDKTKLNTDRTSSTQPSSAASTPTGTKPMVRPGVLGMFDLEPGITFATDKGFYGSDKSHIITYDGSQMRMCCSPFLSPDLTVFNSVSKWLKHTQLLMAAIVLCLILGYSSNVFPDSPMGSNPCLEDDPKRNRNICQLEVVLEDAADSFQWLIAFILSGYVAVTVATWSTRRKNYASLCGNGRNLNIVLSSLLPIDPHDKVLCATRKTLARWVMLAFELAMLKARGNMDSQAGHDFLQESGLLEEGEWAAMVNGDRHSTVFWWIMIKAQKLQQEGILPVEYVVRISLAVSSMRGQANDLMSSLDRDKPFPYVAICGFLVNCNLFLMTLWRAVEWSIWLRAFDGSLLFASSKMWIDMGTLFAWNISYASLYDLGYVLDNPFLDKRIDVAHETIFNGVRRLSTAFAEGDLYLPPSLKEKKLL